MATNPYLPGLEPINTMNNPVWNPITQTFEYNMGDRTDATQPGLPGWDIYDKPGLPSGYPGTSGSLNKRYVDSGLFGTDANVLQPDFSQVNKASMIPEGFIDKMKRLYSGITNTDAAQGMNINYPGGNPYYGQRSPHQGFEEMQFDETVQTPEKKDFNFDGIPSMFLNALNFRNPLSERSSNYNPALAGQIEDLNKVNFLGTQSSPYQIAGGPLAGKNLVSMFGTNDYDEMLANKAAWFQQRKDEGKGFSQKNWDKIIAEQLAREGEIKARDAVQSDRAKIEAYTGRPMSEYRASRPASERQFTGHGKSGMGRDPSDRMAYGGRVGYNKGGRVGILAAF